MRRASRRGWRWRRACVRRVERVYRERGSRKAERTNPARHGGTTAKPAARFAK